MALCPSCDTELLSTSRFCPKCGRAIGNLPPARPAAQARPAGLPDHATRTAVLVIAVVLGVAAATSAVDLVWNAPPGPYYGNYTAKPSVKLTVSNTTTGANVQVAGIQPSSSPSNFKLNIENVSSVTYGSAISMPTSPGGRVNVTVGSGGTSTTFSITWQNPVGSGVVSHDDYFVIVETGGVYSAGTTFSFLLIWAPDGSVLQLVNWNV